MGQACEARAANVADAFRAQPAVKSVLAADCLNEFSEGSYEVHTIGVDYESDRPLAMTSAIYGTDVDGFQSSAYRGAFDDLSSCLSARAAEVVTFEAQTGLSAAFAACVPDQSPLSETYVLSIQAFGRSEISLYGYDFRNHFNSGDRLSDLQVRWLTSELSSRSSSVRLHDHLRFFYYAKSPVSMNLTAPGWFKDPAECTSQMDDAGAIFSHLGSRHLVECQQGAASTRMSVLYLDAMLPMTLPLSQKYSSFEACMKFKPAAAAREQRQDPKGFLGLLCVADSYSEGSFVHHKFLNW